MQNETPPDRAVSVTPLSLDSILTRLAPLNPVVWLALVCVLSGWFLLDTLHVSAGPIDHGVRFYQLAAIISRPVRLFTGVDHGYGFGTALFGLVCVAALLAPLAPLYARDRRAWLGHFAPLALLLACALLLYARTSGEFWATSNEPEAISNDLIRFANDLIHRGGDIAARRVAIGAGGYLAFVGSAVLALRGILHYRKATIA